MFPGSEQKRARNDNSSSRNRPTLMSLLQSSTPASSNRKETMNQSSPGDVTEPRCNARQLDERCGEENPASSSSSSLPAIPDEIESTNVSCWKRWYQGCQSVQHRWPRGVVVLILLLGAVAFALILAVGLNTERVAQQDEFELVARTVARQFEMVMNDYLQAGLWLHQTSFRYGLNGQLVSQADFQQRIYPSFLESNAKRAIPIGIMVNTSHAERAQIEESSREYMRQRDPSYVYPGFRGIEKDPMSGLANMTKSEVRSDQPFYLTMRLVAPLFEDRFIDGNDNADYVDFDFATIPNVKRAYRQALETGLPSITPTCYVSSQTNECSLDIFHPGSKRTREAYHDNGNGGSSANRSNVLGSIGNSYDQQRSTAAVTCWVRDLFNYVNEAVNRPITLYLFDKTDDKNEEAEEQEPLLIGAAQLVTTLCEEYQAQRNSSSGIRGAGRRISRQSGHNHTGFAKSDKVQTKFLPSMKYEDMIRNKEDQFDYYMQIDRNIHGRSWSFVFVASKQDYTPDVRYVAFGAGMLLVAFIALALWVHTDHQKQSKMVQMRATAEAEKAALLVEGARVTAQKERELNDFIAHEVRNPMSAALSACTFLSSALNDDQQQRHKNDHTASSPPPWWSQAEKRKAILDDLHVIDSSLTFINNLLGSMLDLHRSQSNQLTLNPTPTAVYSDILKPVETMLRQHGQLCEVQVQCEPHDMVICVDKLRLKQIVMNLGQNAVKFVTKGFVRIRAGCDNQGMVELRVEDSGPGIPVDRRRRLFSKFQERLDSLHQGTGIGLSVCQMLVELMDGQIIMDESYRSGVEGFPGACFVVQLNTPLIALPEDAKIEGTSPQTLSTHSSSSCSSGGEQSSPPKLPDNLSVLFIDDDTVLRRMFLRSTGKAGPSWNVQEASNGEIGFEMAKQSHFDIIFIDHFFVGAEKQMLGTETAVAMRSAGIQSVLCGLSANDMESAFLQAGADAFMMKPFPCRPDALKQVLAELLKSSGRDGRPSVIPSKSSLHAEQVQNRHSEENTPFLSDEETAKLCFQASQLVG